MLFKTPKLNFVKLDNSWMVSLSWKAIMSLISSTMAIPYFPNLILWLFQSFILINARR